MFLGHIVRNSKLFDFIPNSNFLLSQGVVLGRLVEDHILTKFLESNCTFSSSFYIDNHKLQPIKTLFTFTNHSIFFFYGNKAPVSSFFERNVAYFPKSVNYPLVDFVYFHFETYTIYLIQVFVSKKHRPIGTDFENFLKNMFGEERGKQVKIFRVFFLSRIYIFRYTLVIFPSNLFIISKIVHLFVY